MKGFTFFLLSCFFFQSQVEGADIGWDCFKKESIEANSFSSTEGLLSSIIANHVSAISGEYVDHATDCVLAGPEPLTLQRSYSSNPSIGNFGYESLPLDPIGPYNVIDIGPQHCAWQFNCFSKLYFQSDYIGHAKHRNLSAFVPHAFFTQMLHKKQIKIPKSGYKLEACTIPLVHQKGVTNCSSGAISARTNPKNVLAHFSEKYETCDVVFGSGEKRYYACYEQADEKTGIVSIYKFRPLWDKKPNGTQIVYENGTAKAYNSSKTTLFSSLQFNWKSKKELHIETSHSEPLIYEYKQHKVYLNSPKDHKPRFFLSSLKRPTQPDESYEYTLSASQETWLLSKKKLPANRFLEISYYGFGDQPGEILKMNIKSILDPRNNRVKQLKAPVGTDATPITTHRFFYDFNFDLNGKKEKVSTAEGITTVYDAYDRKSVYSYNKQHRLENLVQFDKDKPYLQTRYVWKEIEISKDHPVIAEVPYPSSDQGNLMGKVIQNGSGDCLQGRFFKYDKKGNILTEKLAGSLTGLSTAPLILDKENNPKPNGVECYQKEFVYSQDAYNLLLEEKEPNGRELHYLYYPESNLIKAKYLLDHKKICAREFYFYDENQALSKKISDNGTKRNESDLSYVTERRFTLYQPRKTMPVGLPECIEELAMDFSTGQIGLLKKTCQTFCKEGRLRKQEVYDAENKLRFTLEWDYDKHGNVIKEVNALGHVVTKKYDDNDNLWIEEGPSPGFCKEHTYDFSNRRTSTKETYNGEIFFTHYRYDLVGNCVAKTDRSGNETNYRYDHLNRLIETIYPLTEGSPIRIAKQTAYDCLGNPVEEIDGRGCKTVKTYNARGKATSILHPDGQLECFEYYLDGNLAKKVASNGTKTSFELDCFGRILKETARSRAGELLYETSNTYNSLHKTSSTDEMGLITEYTYDYAGRLIQTKCLNKIERYEYDALGRLAKKIEPAVADKLKITCMEYDLLNRIIEERIENKMGGVHRKVSYQYDHFGNRSHVIEEAQGGASRHMTFYNADKKPVKMVDPEKNETHIVYNYAFKNSLGQFVLQSITTDPLGRRTIINHDAWERPISIKRQDAFGTLLAWQDVQYDPDDHETALIDHVIVQGEEIRRIETALAYEEGGQLTEMIQAKGLPKQQTTHTKYNCYGEKECVTKNDGTLLISTYDSLGRLDTYSSSDDTVAYKYHYNPRNQVVQVDDLIAKSSSILTYHPRGLLFKETLSNGTTIEYEYDQLDRVNKVILPDSSSIAYTYNSANLKKIERIKNKKVIYTHCYDAYDLAGLPVKSTSITTGVIKHAYDISKRPLSMDGPVCKLSLAKYDKDGHLKEYASADPIGKLNTAYTYDDLDHLVSESGHCTNSYACDSLHNRLCKNEIKYQSNALHQLKQNGQCTYDYDLAGNLKQKIDGAQITHFVYDANDRLTEVKGKVKYQYDAFNRRVAKIEGEKRTRYLYVGQNEIGSIDESGNIQELRILGWGHGAEIGASVAIELKNEIFVPSHNFRGNIMCLADLKGKGVEIYRYSAFGETTIYDQEGTKIKKSSLNNPWRFCSKRFDEETGFVNFGRRYYDAENGRWVTQDPQGMEDGPNLYAYLHHNPTNGFDLYGLQEEAADTEARTPLQNVNYHDGPEKSVEDATPNETPLGFEEKKSGKKGSLFFLGEIQLYELGIGRINGMMNNFKEICKQGLALSEMACNHFVTFTRNFSTGFILTDLLRCALELHFRVGFAAEKALLSQFYGYFENASPNAMYFHECHSEGAIITRNALMKLPDNYRKRIILAAFAPGAYIENKYCYKVTHYRSTRDIVPHLDVVGAYKCRHSTVVLKPHPDAPFFDHGIDSPTYLDFREKGVLNYYREFGGAKCA